MTMEKPIYGESIPLQRVVPAATWRAGMVRAVFTQNGDHSRGPNYRAEKSHGHERVTVLGEHGSVVTTNFTTSNSVAVPPNQVQKAMVTAGQTVTRFCAWTSRRTSWTSKLCGSMSGKVTVEVTNGCQGKIDDGQLVVYTAGACTGLTMNGYLTLVVVSRWLINYG